MLLLPLRLTLPLTLSRFMVEGVCAWRHEARECHVVS